MEKRKLRGALIGYGFISARGHTPAYIARDDVEIVAVADVSSVRTNLAHQTLPQARIYTDFRRLLKHEAANLDFADISTPPFDHAAAAHAAFAAGLHVLCEKPLACKVEDAFSLLTHARTARRVLFPCHNYKYAPAIKAIGKIIRSGHIGRVQSVFLKTLRNTYAKGVAEWNAHWRRDSRYSGGGIAMDHGIHNFYLAFEWLGAYPTAISAAMSNHDPDVYDTEDEFSATVSFPTGLAQIELSWTSDRREVMYVIKGDEGTITLANNRLSIDVFNGRRNPHSTQTSQSNVEVRSIDSDWADASHAAWFNPLFDAFLRSIANSKYAGKEAQEAVLCLQLISTAYQSARNGSRQLPVTNVTGRDATPPSADVIS